ncbi:MAG: phosphoribosyltransferase family protein [Candidatus Bathyarchaeota archaeon]|nr:phosphoribosyltransferase family protein [Candidatus Bathyarchaeota archaeon]
MTAKITEEPKCRERTFVFKDRLHAGRILAEKLREYAGNRRAMVLAVPAGGVPVGYVVAGELAVAMDVVVVRKVQIPWNPEAGFGAVTWDGEIVLNEGLVSDLGLTEKMIEESMLKTRRIIQERIRKFRGDRSMPDLGGKIVFLVDDGLASGFTMLAAARSVRKREPAKVVIAVPTASLRALQLLESEADEIISLNIRSGPIFAVADAYENWYDLSDEEVTELLERAMKIQ